MSASLKHRASPEFPERRHRRPKRAREVVVNAAPCVRCGFVYGWEGRPDQIADSLRRTGGLCPACVVGNPTPTNGNPHRGRGDGRLPGRAAQALVGRDLRRTRLR